MQVKFNNRGADFYATLKTRTEAYFQAHNLKPTGNIKLYAKTAVLSLVFVAVYVALVFLSPPTWLAVLLCVIMGLDMAAIGFNMMHDGAHGSYSQNKKINEMMGLSLNFLGANVFFWKQKHNVNHHSYTNIEGMDDDIDVNPFLRLHTEQQKRWFHRFQHFYALLAYSLMFFFWVFYRDFKKYFSGKIARYTPIRNMTVKEHIIFWVSKVVHVAVFLVVPMIFAGVVPTIVGYLIITFVLGLVISVVFQLAHVVEGTEFVTPLTEESVTVEAEWAVHQVSTTANFATSNPLVNWFMGGLNFQVEHHLFPGVSHIHYPQLNRILKETCREFNIKYMEFATVTGAFVSHMRHLKQMGIA